MLANKLFQLLSRPDVQEIVLRRDKPPSALVSGGYRALSAQLLCDEDIVSVLTAAHGQEQLGRLKEGCRWRFQLPSVGTIAVSAGYEAGVLQATLRLSRAGAAPSPEEARGQKPPPSAADEATRQGRVSSQRAVAAAGSAGQRAARPQAAREARAHDPQPRAHDAPATRESRAHDAPNREPRAHDAQAAREPRGHDAASREPRAHDAHGAREGRGHDPRARDLQPAREEPFDEEELELEERPPAPLRQRLAPGSDLLDELFGRARAEQASDLHVLAQRPAMLRIAGELVPQAEVISADDAERMLLSRVPTHLHPSLVQQGSIDFSLVHPQFGRFRANVCRQRTGWKLTARPIGQQVSTLEELGLPASIAQALHHHQGLIVITGPTGHGKTTTLAALVGILNRETSHHVITVEDPIEYVHETARAVLSQREVGTHTKTFQAALKGALREDPDVIVVGELRDTETVRMALSASETGHLVISTMNTPSAAKAIERLIDLFPPGDQPQVRMMLAGGLRLIISQRLLPTADRKRLCAAAEVLPGSTPLWNLIRENRTYQIVSLQQRGKSLGIIRMDDSLAELVRRGETTLEIAREYAESSDLLEATLAGRNLAARPEAAPENQNDASDPAGNLQKRGVELGKQVMSRAGKFFGGDNK
jgi:twitching motility protein PilT